MEITRRDAMKKLSLGAGLVGSASLASTSVTQAMDSSPISLKGNVNHSVCRWPYGSLTVEELARAARDIGIGAMEIVGPADFETLRKYDLVCSMSNGPGSIERGFNRVEHHDELVAGYERMIPQVAAYGFPNIICFSGNREGLDDEEGIENCVTGLRRIIHLAEEHDVTICMEPLNSKVDHRDYHADRTAWGVEVAKRLGSDHFKILYDIYHMQVMEGDVIRTIRENAPYIAHYHTGGVPGRNEIDKSQELNYPAIVQAIVNTGFKGWVGQEFIPTRDPLTSLREAVELCDV